MSKPSGILFNETYYLSKNPDVQAAVKAGVFASGYGHWQAYGSREDRPASPFFDWQVYRDENSDLVDAGLTTPAEFISHFNAYGFYENRVFMSKNLFDDQYYAQQNPDLAAAGITTRAQLQHHFVTYGVLEGRSASPLVGGAAYLNQNLDVKAYLQKGGSLNGITDPEKFGIYHFYNHGIVEGRKAVPTAQPFLVSIAVGGDAYINKAENSLLTGITLTVTSSTLSTTPLTVYGTKNKVPSSEVASWSNAKSLFEFNARNFDDGVLIMAVSDVYGQTKSLTLTKDTVAPTFVNLSVTSPTTLSVASSEKGKVGLYDFVNIHSVNERPITGSETTMASANTPVTITLSAQSALKYLFLRLHDEAGNASDSSTGVVLGSDIAETMAAPSTANYMFGFGGNDVITGGTEADVIYAGAGNDTITGAAGVDVIDLGTGVDTIVLGTVNNGDIDTVSNFTSEDFIKFAGGLSYWDDTILGDMQSKGTLIEAANYVVGTFDGWALGFVYKGETYVVIDGAKGTSQFNASTDAIVKLVGMNLGTLSAANFTA